MTKEDYLNLRISRAALGRHLADLIDNLLAKEVVGDVFADTMVAVYLHILDADYQPSADSLSDCDPEIFADASCAIARSAARSAMARESARRRKAGLRPLSRPKKAKKPRRHNMIDASLEKLKDTPVAERYEKGPEIITSGNVQLLGTGQDGVIQIGPADDIPLTGFADEWQQIFRSIWEKSQSSDSLGP